MDKRERNKTIVAGIGNESENQRHIFSRLLQRFKRNRAVAVAMKQIRQDKQKALSNIEMYLDDWAYHHGGLTQANVHQAMSDCVDRMLTLHQAKQQQREAQEERALSGGLGDGFDGEFGDLPGDGEIEDALIKADPSLKQYRQ